MLFIRFMFILLSSTLFFTHVLAGVQQGLKEAFDDFNFALMVEWDQEDQNFYDQKVRELSEKLQAFQTEGVHYREILEMEVIQTKDEHLRRELDLVLNQIELNKIPGPETENKSAR